MAVSVLAALVLFFVVLEPLVVLAHELGHAAIPIARGHSATVVLGGIGGRRASVGRLTVVVDPRELLTPLTFGLAQWDEAAGRRTDVVASLAGPAVSAGLLVLALAAVDSTTGFANEVAEATAIYLLFQTALTLLPIRYPWFAGRLAGCKSDGLCALQHLLDRELPGQWPGDAGSARD